MKPVFISLSELNSEDIYYYCREYLEQIYKFVDACDMYQIIASNDLTSDKYFQFETGCDAKGRPSLRNVETGEIIVIY